MMVALGNFLFRFRNGLFPLAYLLLLVKSPRLFANEYIALGLGLTLALMGQILRAVTIGLVYIRRGGKNRQVYANNLVTEGIFAHCRNPLYVGNFLIIAGVGLVSNSLYFVAIMVPAFFVAYWAIISAEEAFLRNKFGAEYDNYCARVHRVLPNFAGLSQTLGQHSFNWRRLVVKEYGSTFAWTAGVLLIIAWNRWRYHEYGSTANLLPILASFLATDIVVWGVARYCKKAEIITAD
jgi:protein-S-isoprenylcysteine O-methyltransferase Ste14